MYEASCWRCHLFDIIPSHLFKTSLSCNSAIKIINTCFKTGTVPLYFKQAMGRRPGVICLWFHLLLLSGEKRPPAAATSPSQRQLLCPHLRMADGLVPIWWFSTLSTQSAPKQSKACQITPSLRWYRRPVDPDQPEPSSSTQACF